MKRRWGVVCMWLEVGSKKRGPSRDFISGGGGGFKNILEKRHAARGDLSYAFTKGVWGRASPRIF